MTTPPNLWTYQEWRPYCVGCKWLGEWTRHYPHATAARDTHDRHHHEQAPSHPGQLLRFFRAAAGIQTRTVQDPLPADWVPQVGMPVTVARVRGPKVVRAYCTTLGTQGGQWEFREVTGKGRRVFLIPPRDLLACVRPGWAGLA